MASMCSKEDARDNEELVKATNTSSQKQQLPADSDTIEKNPGRAVAAKKCPTCAGSGSIPGAEEQPAKPQQQQQSSDAPKSSAAVNIDQDVPDIYSQLPPFPSPFPTPHPDFIHALPPTPPTYRKYSIFTAGSIEMGAAVQWQKHLATLLSPLPITVLNPRRGHWDPTVTPEAKDASFRQQVEWELGALEQADVIAFFFDVNTKSPVTLLELGLWAASGKVVVCCDRRYWRAGNVHIVCARYGVPFVESFGELAPEVERMLREKGMRVDERGDLVGGNEHVEKKVQKMVLGG